MLWSSLGDSAIPPGGLVDNPLQHYLTSDATRAAALPLIWEHSPWVG